MQDAKVHADEKVTRAATAEAATAAAKKVYVQLQKQMDMRRPKLTLNEERKEGHLRYDARADDARKTCKNLCMVGGFGLTYSAEYSGDDARGVVECKKKFGKWRRRHEKMNQTMEAVRTIKNFNNTYSSAGTKLVTMYQQERGKVTQ